MTIWASRLVDTSHLPDIEQGAIPALWPVSTMAADGIHLAGRVPEVAGVG